MTLDEFMTRARHTGRTLGHKVSLSKDAVNKIRRGDRGMSPAAYVRFWWASKGLMTPSANGLERDSRLWLPPLDKLPDPDDPGVTWAKDCAPVLARLRAQQAVAKREGANP